MGRTLPIWNSHGAVAPFTPHKPWLLEIFDQIRFKVRSAHCTATLECTAKCGHSNAVLSQRRASLADLPTSRCSGCQYGSDALELCWTRVSWCAVQGCRRRQSSSFSTCTSSTSLAIMMLIVIDHL